MPYVFGSSYDSLANQRMGYDELSVRLAESDRAARERAAAQAQAEQGRQEELQQRQADSRANAAYVFNDAQQKQRNFEQQQAESKYQFGETQKMEGRRLTDAEQKEKDAVAAGKTDTQLRDRSGDYKDALDAIKSGAILEPADLDAYANLTSTDRLQLIPRIVAGNTQRFQDYLQHAQIAGQVNGAVQQKRTATPATPEQPASWMKFRFSDTPAKPATFKQWTEDDASKALAETKEAQYAQLVHWDEDSQSFVPNVKKPSGFDVWKLGLLHGKTLQDSRASQPPNPGAGVGSPAAGAGAAPAAAAAAVGTGYRFGPTNAPPAMPTPAPMPASAPAMPSAPAMALPAGQNPPANPLFQFGQPVGSPVMRSAASGPRRMPTPFYQRVNQLEGAGLPTAQAIAQALREFSSSQ